ncbi:MAG: cupin domain-containing protein [Armatimonadetes bacterium]|nr:cupin domain-containing protein [Armatimonadota bacterium]
MITTDFLSGTMTGEVSRSARTVGDLLEYWGDRDAAQAMASTPLYETETYFSKPDGTEGAILWGSTTLHPGTVGGEYFMTRGHWHTKPTHGELILVVSGQGLVVLMDHQRKTTTVELRPGVTYHIDGTLAHRTVNTGDEPLIFWCAWAADCGHDYESIRTDGFSERFFA